MTPEERERLRVRVDAPLTAPMVFHPNDEADLRAWLREEMRREMLHALGVPYDQIDGRPWVRTHEEEHPTYLWGTGYPEGCGHALCGNRTTELTGILDMPGVTRWTPESIGDRTCTCAEPRPVPITRAFPADAWIRCRACKGLIAP